MPHLIGQSIPNPTFRSGGIAGTLSGVASRELPRPAPTRDPVSAGLEADAGLTP